jgi:transposase-like protein
VELREEPILIAVLECPPCDERAYSAIVPKRPELTPSCPKCGETFTVADLIVGE